MKNQGNIVTQINVLIESGSFKLTVYCFIWRIIL